MHRLMNCTGFIRPQLFKRCGISYYGSLESKSETQGPHHDQKRSHANHSVGKQKICFHLLSHCNRVLPIWIRFLNYRWIPSDGRLPRSLRRPRSHISNRMEFVCPCSTTHQFPHDIGSLRWLVLRWSHRQLPQPSLVNLCWLGSLRHCGHPNGHHYESRRSLLWSFPLGLCKVSPLKWNLANFPVASS
jgi:hypothetical protein